MIEQRLFTTPQTETTSDDYYTPKWIFDTLGLHFDLDVASPPHATNVPCNRYFTQADDGLAQEWHGRVWMNPPFSNPTPWVTRFVEHGNGVGLVPSSNGKWWLHLWQSIRTHLACGMANATPKEYTQGQKAKRHAICSTGKRQNLGCLICDVECLSCLLSAFCFHLNFNINNFST